MREVVPAARFVADVAAQIAALRASEDWDWVEILVGDIGEIRGLLAEFPNAGRELAHEGSRTLRKLRLRHAPFYVWYRTADGEQTRLARLFHVRQRTPRPRAR